MKNAAGIVTTLPSAAREKGTTLRISGWLISSTAIKGDAGAVLQVNV